MFVVFRITAEGNTMLKWDCLEDSWPQNTVRRRREIEWRKTKTDVK